MNTENQITCLSVCCNKPPDQKEFLYRMGPFPISDPFGDKKYFGKCPKCGAFTDFKEEETK